MANILAPQSNVTTAGAVGVVAISVLKIMKANGINIPDDVLTELPTAITVLTAYAHDVVMAYLEQKK